MGVTMSQGRGWWVVLAGAGLVAGTAGCGSDGDKKSSSNAAGGSGATSGSSSGGSSPGGATSGGSTSGGSTSGGSSGSAQGGSGGVGGSTAGTGAAGGSGGTGGSAGNGGSGGTSAPGNFDCSPRTGMAFPDNVRLVEYASFFDSPVQAVAAPGDPGRMYVVTRHGTIRIVDGNGDVLPTPFLDIHTAVISDDSEQGLLGLAFHPDYASNGKFYIHYNYPTSGQPHGDGRISEMQRDANNPDIADSNSERTLLEVEQPAWNHDGGTLEFGPLDGLLYISKGDGARRNRAPDLDLLNGKLLRIDVDSQPAGAPYGIPAGNQTGAAPEVWAWGLRNPWRFNIDPCNGDVYVADVGQSSWEEVTRVSANETNLDFGWPMFEGTSCYDAPCDDPPGSLTPQAVYDHQGGRCSVTGGFIYRGSAIPALRGWYLYTDYCSGQFWAFPGDEADGSADPLTFATEVTSIINPMGVDFVTSFGQDFDGNIYVLSASGIMYRVEAQ